MRYKGLKTQKIPDEMGFFDVFQISADIHYRDVL